MSNTEEDNEKKVNISSQDNSSEPSILDLMTLMQSMQDSLATKTDLTEIKTELADLRVSSDKYWRHIESFREDLNHISAECVLQNQITIDQSKSFTENKISHVRQELLEKINHVTERVCLLEGNSSKLRALETTVKNIQSFLGSGKNSNLFSSTQRSSTGPNYKHARFNFGEVSTDNFLPPSNASGVNPNITINLEPPANTVNFQNIPNFKNQPVQYSFLDLSHEAKTEISEYDGRLEPIHPEEFLVQLIQYFQSQLLTETQKITIATSRLTQGAKSWYNVVYPIPITFSEFIDQFRNYFWSLDIQENIRNKLNRPVFVEDIYKLKQHSIEWIGKTKYLNPPMSQAEMVTKLMHHYPTNIGISLKGLKIQSSYELIQHLTSYEQYHRLYHNSNVHQNSNDHNNWHSQERLNNFAQKNSRFNRPHNNNDTNSSSGNHNDNNNDSSGHRDNNNGTISNNRNVFFDQAPPNTDQLITSTANNVLNTTQIDSEWPDTNTGQIDKR